ncbi:MAG: hypothetical protein A4E63_02959 [Syntrophorhabdus sp. PtaU1.Bin050]|nr:MAG: hypothetical protein A4E63_02959 [Syntrophorhabdus sp. PtaU1.Bin050]
MYGNNELIARMVYVLQVGKKELDSLVMELGRLLAETIMDMEQEERPGPEGKPLHEGMHKWAYQQGSIYCGDQKIHVNHPRLRGPKGEITLSTYETLKQRGAFSEELLARALRGISGRRHKETVILYCEQGFRRVKGYSHIADLIERIERKQGDTASVAA